MFGCQQILLTMRRFSTLKSIGSQCRSFGRTRPYAGQRTMHTPTNFDKRVLVFTKFYPSVEDVPASVTRAQMVKAKDIARIRVSIGMIVAAVIAGIGMVISGKRARARGESAEAEMIRWTQELAEQGRRERAAAAAAAAATNADK